MSSHRSTPHAARSRVFGAAFLGFATLSGCRGLGDAPLAPARASLATQSAAPLPDVLSQEPRALPETTPSSAKAAAVDAPVLAPPIAWRFQTAAPSSGAAAVSDDGSVFIATVEGYVHALDPAGGFRWSYGLAGMPVGSPAVDRVGHVYVATSAQRLYALRPDGHLDWMQRLPSRVVTDVVWTRPGTLFFGGRDRRLYSFAAWGGPLWSRQLPNAPSAAPTSLNGGWVGQGTTLPELWLFRNGAHASRVPLPGELSQPILAGGEHWFAVAGGEIVAIAAGDEGRVVWRSEARLAALSEDAESLVVVARHELCWLQPKTGERLYAAELPDEPSAPPSVADRGLAMIPLISGELFLVEPGGGATARVRVASAPLRPLHFSERTGTAVAVGSGVVAAIDLHAWPKGLQVDSDETDAVDSSARGG